MNNPFESIAECIESKKSFCFNSGAGSGKTYNLVKTIDYLAEKKGKTLLENNQKIMVITYTNAATDEIIRRIGKNSICDISTIHTRLWEIIRHFQSDLVGLQLDKINETLLNLKVDLESNPYYGDMALDNELETNKDFIKLFYKHITLSAAEFKKMFAQYTKDNKISKVNDFKKYVKKTWRYHKLLKAKEGIISKEKGYKRVEYDPFDNVDKLYKMKFSHDTLIDYARKLVAKNKTLKKIISDRYPFVLIDEYQDASAKVIEIFGDLLPHIVVGFYGDSCQNIYGDGVGDKIDEIISGLERINNVINWRSASNIVQLGNRIRNDDLVQQPYSQNKGSVEVYYSTHNEDQVIDSFIKNVSNEFCESGVDFFLLKNEQVANKNGFGSFFQTLSGTDYYKNNYGQTTTEILSDDTTKLGTIPLHLYYLVRFVSLVKSEKSIISSYIPKSVFGKLNLALLNDLVRKMKNMVDAATLGSLIANLIGFKKTDLNISETIVDNIKNFSFEEFDDYKNFLMNTLYGDIAEEKIDDAYKRIEELLDISLNQLLNWYSYLTGGVNKSIKFHTFHGTKGLEFDNVGIVITNEFNREKNYFHSLFAEWGANTKNAEFVEKKNLLYVAVTRAKKNLRILYLDSDYNSISETFNTIFPASSEYKIEN